MVETCKVPRKAPVVENGPADLRAEGFGFVPAAALNCCQYNSCDGGMCVFVLFDVVALGGMEPPHSVSMWFLSL